MNSSADPSDLALPSDLVGEQGTNLTASAPRAEQATGIVAQDDTSENGDNPNLGETAEATPAEAVEQPKTEEQPPAPPANAELLAKIERIARVEERLRNERQQALAARREAEAKTAEINRFNEDLQRLRGNPVEAAKFLGLDPRELVRAMLGEEAAPKTEQELLNEKLAQIEAWKAQQEKAAEEAKVSAQRAQQEAALQKLALDAERGVREAGDEFELINARGDYQRVLDTQIEYFNLHKAPLDWRTAASYVEQALEKEARVYLGTKKLSAGQQPAAAVAQKPQAPAVTQAPPKAIPGSRTLTSRPIAKPTADAPERVSINTSYLDRDDSIEQMAAALSAARRSA